jgi:hypothetical protein
MLMLAHTSFSQTNVDSLFLDQQSQLNLIDKTRSLLIDAFVQNDKQKVQELHRYLSENFDQNNYITLLPVEKTLLFAWSGDFENMLQYAEEADSEYFAQIRTKIRPNFNNNFYQTIKNRVQQELEVILNDLQFSFLTQEEKDFAAIYLHYYLITKESYDTIVRTINTDTRKFIETYPDSEYMKLLESYELKPSDWGWNFGVNFGYSVKTGNLSNYFNKHDGAMDLYIGIAYKKIMAIIGLWGAFGRVQKDIIISDELVLPKGISASVDNLYLSFGYRFFDDKRFIITPIAGIGTAFVNPGTQKDREDNPTLKQFNYSYSLTTNFGLMTDIRLGKMKKIPGQNFAEPSFCAVRLGYRFSYNNITQAPTHYNGNLHNITVGILLHGRSIKSVKYK